jgi:hypothetical protein
MAFDDNKGGYVIPISKTEIGGVAAAVNGARDRLLNTLEVVAKPFYAKVYTNNGFSQHIALISEGAEITGPRGNVKGERTLCGVRSIELNTMFGQSTEGVMETETHSMCKKCLKKIQALNVEGAVTIIPAKKSTLYSLGLEKVRIDFNKLSAAIKEE